MDKPLIDALVERVDRLEQECSELKCANRRWRRAGAAASLVAGLALVLGAEADKVFEGDAFLIRDRAGTERLSLRLSENDQPVIEFFDKKGQRRMVLGEAPDGGPAIKFKDEAGTDRGGLGAITERDAYGLNFKDRKGISRIALGAESGGLTSFYSKDKDGKSRISIETEADGKPHLQLFDGEGNPLFEAPAR